MAAADFLLVDNSNSFTKFALSTRDTVCGPARKTPTRSMDARAIGKTIRGWKFRRVVLCSVVPEKGALLAEELGKLAPVLAVTSDVELGVGIDYPQPKKIGADRLANAAAVGESKRAPIVVVDFGTAVTFDIVAKCSSGGLKYIGGVIAPGLEAMTDYLHQRTAQLPKITLLEPPSPIGKSTKHAMLAGAVYGYRGLVREILSKVRAELGARRLHVVATGGYADLIAAGVPEIHEVRDGLTLDGLRVIGNLNATRSPATT